MPDWYRPFLLFKLRCYAAIGIGKRSNVPHFFRLLAGTPTIEKWFDCCKSAFMKRSNAKKAREIRIMTTIYSITSFLAP